MKIADLFACVGWHALAIVEKFGKAFLKINIKNSERIKTAKVKLNCLKINTPKMSLKIIFFQSHSF
jgi:hypothetical protein